MCMNCEKIILENNLFLIYSDVFDFRRQTPSALLQKLGFLLIYKCIRRTDDDVSVMSCMSLLPDRLVVFYHFHAVYTL